MKPSRRNFLRLAAGASTLPSVSRFAWAQSYPTRPVRLIVPAAAGGPGDFIGRLIAQKLSESWGKQFIVEDIPTGAGNMAVGMVAKAPPDGHTLLVISTAFVINPGLYAKLAYDPIRDFAPVTLVAASPNAVTVHPSLPARTIKELIALVKANPGKYSYASAGAGQSGHLAGELFKLRFGLDLVHVPFNGGAGAMTATIGGHTQVAFNALPAAAPYIKDGKLRALAVTSSRRTPEFPDVPTLAEAGAPDQESLFLQGIVAPAGTPKQIIDLLNREIISLLAMPDVAERLATIGFYVRTNSPEDFGALIKSEITKWSKVIREAGIEQIQ
jgi:tripartite-type tricarboxylate transporter receptor subunit TctC